MSTEPSTPHRNQPATPRRNRPAISDNVQSESRAVNDASVHLQFSVPVELAREFKWTLQLSPRRRAPGHIAAPSPAVPLQLNHEAHVHLSANHGAPPSPPVSPLPLAPPLPSPQQPTLRVPQRRPPVVSYFPTNQSLRLTYIAGCPVTPTSTSYLPTSPEYVAPLGPHTGKPSRYKTILCDN